MGVCQPLRLFDGKAVYLVPPLGDGESKDMRLLMGVCGARLLMHPPSHGRCVNDDTPAAFLCATCNRWTSNVPLAYPGNDPLSATAMSASLDVSPIAHRASLDGAGVDDPSATVDAAELALPTYGGLCMCHAVDGRLKARPHRARTVRYVKGVCVRVLRGCCISAL